MKKPKWTMISKENIFLVAKNILNGIWTQEAIQNIQIQSITQMLCLWYFFWNRWESLRNIHKKIKIKDRLNNFNEISPFFANVWQGCCRQRRTRQLCRPCSCLWTWGIYWIYSISKFKRRYYKCWSYMLVVVLLHSNIYPEKYYLVDLLVEIWQSPWMVEFSRNSLKLSIACLGILATFLCTPCVKYKYNLLNPKVWNEPI